MTATGTTRRRFIAIVGAVAAAALVPRVGSAAARPHLWRGVALGAGASIQLLHPDASEARRIIEPAVAEIERLEMIFSLYRAGSAVTTLNRRCTREDRAAQRQGDAQTFTSGIPSDRPGCQRIGR